MARQANDLKRWLQKWQRRLRLADWKITVTAASRRELSTRDELVWGTCQILDVAERDARIRIRKRREWKEPGNDPAAPSEEGTLIHETLHVYFPPADDEPQTMTDLREQGINTLVDILLKAKWEDE